jgi:hypothetical protein
MFVLVGAAAGALSALAPSQQTSGSGGPAGAASPAAPPPSPFDLLTAGATGGAAPSGAGAMSPPCSPGTMSALIAAQSQHTTGQAAVLNKLDANGDGSVSENALDSPQKQSGHRHRHHPIDGGGAMGIAGSADGAGSAAGAGGLEPLLASNAAGASTQSVANADGSTTTTITDADGSKLAMTTAAPSSDSSGSTSSGSERKGSNFLEQLIGIQAQSFTASSVTPPTA